MKLELISFKLCPFLQRVLITMLHHDIEHQVTYINPQEPPDWLLKIAPSGKTPVLRVDDDTVLSESGIINEFVDELGSASLLPADPLEKAVMRSWTEFGASLFPDNHDLITATCKEDFDAAAKTVSEKFSRIEAQVTGPFFSGEQLSLIDTIYAPALLRFNLNQEITPVYPVDDYPKLKELAQNYQQLDATKYSVTADFEELYRNMLKARGGYLGSLLSE